jgi:hypothetical protein
MAAGSTYTPIATTTLGSAASSYTFSSIPGTYTDLVLVIQTKHSSSGVGFWVQSQINGDTGTNYSNTFLRGTGIAAPSSGRYSNRGEGMFFGLCDHTQFGVYTINFQNYSNTTTYKTALARGSSATDSAMTQVNLWRNTAAITSLKIWIENGSVNMVTGSTLTLYGITAA